MIILLASFNSNIYLIQDTHIIDIHSIPHSNGSVFEWVDSLVEMMETATQNNCRISNVSAWISDPFFDTSVRDHCKLYLKTTLSEHWNFHIHNYSLTNFGLRLFGIIWCVQLQKIVTTESFDNTEAFLPCRNKMRDS